jgi:hypothetical protein
LSTYGKRIPDPAARLIDAVAPVLQSEARMFARG